MIARAIGAIFVAISITKKNTQFKYFKIDLDQILKFEFFI